MFLFFFDDLLWLFCCFLAVILLVCAVQREKVDRERGERGERGEGEREGLVDCSEKQYRLNLFDSVYKTTFIWLPGV